MTIPSGAPVVTLAPGTQPFASTSTTTSALAATFSPIAPTEAVLEIGEKGTDGQYYQVAFFEIDGITQSDYGTALAGVLNYCSIAGRTNWDGPGAQAFVNSTPMATLLPLLMPWLMGPLVTQFETQLKTVYGTVTPPSTNIHLLDIINAFIPGCVVKANGDGTFTITHP